MIESRTVKERFYAMFSLHQLSAYEMAALGAIVTFSATTLGALPAVFIKTLSEKTKDLFLGVSAGVMLAATAFSLIEPSVGLFQKQFSTPLSALFSGLMILMGGLILHLGNEHIPHEHFLGKKESIKPEKFKQIWLFVLAITIHNIPEGFAVGTALGSGNFQISLPVTFGIAFQDLPEGLVVAIALRTLGYSIKDSFIVAGITGLVEAIAALIGFYAVITIQTLLPWTLAFAGGMMLYVVSHEMIPESHKNGYEKNATAGIMIGFVIMMLLDVLLK
jgi:ZIP family zinc transporter